MMDDGVSRLREFIRAEDKRGDLCNLTDASGLPNQPPQIGANCTLAVPTTSGAGNATLV